MARGRRKGKSGAEAGGKAPKQKKPKVKGALLTRVTNVVLVLFLLSLAAQRLTG